MLTRPCFALQATWRLTTQLKLPWRPCIDVSGSTDYLLNSSETQVILLQGLFQISILASIAYNKMVPVVWFHQYWTGIPADLLHPVHAVFSANWCQLCMMTSTTFTNIGAYLTHASAQIPLLLHKSSSPQTLID